MTDEQIIKALECCEASENKCDDCPFYGVKEDCEVELPEEALDLIKRQNNLIEQLGNDVNRKYNLLCKMEEILRNLKSEAIKEFAERLKRTSIGLEIGDDKKFKMTVVSTVAIDNLVKEILVKEMTEGK